MRDDSSSTELIVSRDKHVMQQIHLITVFT